MRWKMAIGSLNDTACCTSLPKGRPTYSNCRSYFSVQKFSNFCFRDSGYPCVGSCQLLTKINQNESTLGKKVFNYAWRRIICVLTRALGSLLLLTASFFTNTRINKEDKLRFYEKISHYAQGVVLGGYYWRLCPSSIPTADGKLNSLYRWTF